MNTKRILIFLFKKLWGGLTAPFESLPQTGDYRRAVTTSVFFLFAIISIILERLVAGKTPISALILLIVGYFLARTRWFKIEALSLVLTLTFPSYIVALRLPNPDPSHISYAIGWAIIPLLLSSLIYSAQVTIAISVINFLVLASLPLIRPELSFQVIGGALGFYGLTSIILIIVTTQRNQIEQDHQKELITSQTQLSQEILERERFAEQAQRRADDLVMLNEVSIAISSLMELDNIF